VNTNGKPHRKTTIWLGSDDEGEDGSSGYGYGVHREDAMVSITFAARGENGEDLEVFILPDLFPKIRKAMDAIEKRQRGRGEPGESG
jgi:hypothetical protein